MTPTSRIFKSVAILSALSISASALAHDDHDKGERVTEVYDYSGFEHLDIGGVYDLSVSVGESYAVTTSGPEKEMKNISVYIDGNTLRLERKKKKWKKSNNTHAVDVIISMPKLKSVEIGGVGQGDIQGIDTKNFELSIGGVGELTLSGTCKSFEADIAGVGEIDAKDFKCENVDVDLAGVGEVNVYASQSVDASAAGVGEVNVWGKPSKVVKSKGFLSSVTIR